MLRKIRESMEKRDEGFTLIELLVVVIIIGILAAIAIPVFLNQREKAWDKAVQSDLRNAATAQETWFTDVTPSAYTENLADLTLDTIGFNNSVNVVFDNDGTFVTDYPGVASNGYCMEAHHTANAARIWSWNSDEGAPVLGGC